MRRIITILMAVVMGVGLMLGISSPAHAYSCSSTVRVTSTNNVYSYSGSLPSGTKRQTINISYGWVFETRQTYPNKPVPYSTTRHADIRWVQVKITVQTSSGPRTFTCATQYTDF